LQLFHQGCGRNLHSARTAVAENCRRCCLDNAESAAHRIITVKFAPLVHRASLASSRQLGGGPEPCNGPAAHTAPLDALQHRSRRGHVITQYGPIATGPLNGPQMRLHRAQGSEPLPKPRLRTALLLERRTYARRGYEALNQLRVDSLPLSTALGITNCLASIHDGSATPAILQFKEATPDKSQSQWIGVFARFPLPHFADEA
jgi:hypothetical protein